MPMRTKVVDGRCRAVSPLIRNVKDGSVMALVPGGEFEMGDGKCMLRPKHRVYVDAFYIGVYCVTNAQYTVFIKATGHRPQERINNIFDHSEPVWVNGRCLEAKLNNPVVCVSWDDATAYAEWAGLELATEVQWEKAARGPKNLIYPWGNDWDAGKCRNITNKGNGTTSDVWEYPFGVSGFGTNNQSGNVSEWCRDWYDKASYIERNALVWNVVSVSIRGHRGGSWGIGDAEFLRGAHSSHKNLIDRDVYTGFRLVRAA